MSTLSEQLSLFASNDDDLAMPFVEQEPDDIPEPSSSSDDDDDTKLSRLSEIMSKGHPSKKEDPKFDRSSLHLLKEEDISENFDFLMGAFGDDDEDIELRQSLTSMGRKYARETEILGEGSEVQKMFSGNEKAITTLIREVRGDKDQIEKDIAHLSSMRSKNFKVLSEMREIRNEFHNTELSAIKELNAMKKTQYELQLKAKAAQKSNEDSSAMNGNLISNLFSIGRKNIIGNGYGAVSGARDEDYVSSETVSSAASSNPDDDIPDFVLEEEGESDGDKFLKYRDAGVHYVLLYSKEGVQGVLAEDKDGNIVDDYPMPSDIDSLAFEMDKKLGIAKDNYNNEYIIREV